jgi:lipopolysaccharide biosynthesis glycosyltransferase
VLVIDPSHDTFTAMLSKFGELKSGDGGDQGFLNLFFKDKWSYLPYVYNFLKHNMGNHFEYYIANSMHRIKIIHYVGPKPWTCHRDVDCTLEVSSGYAALGLYDVWWGAFDGLCNFRNVHCTNNSLR